MDSDPMQDGSQIVRSGTESTGAGERMCHDPGLKCLYRRRHVIPSRLDLLRSVILRHPAAKHCPRWVAATRARSL